MARILVVEDDRAVVEMLEQALATWGHDVCVARNGKAAYEAIVTRTQDYDVIVCDLYLGEMSGKALLDRVGATIRGRTPVIVMSGIAHELEMLGETREWAFRVLSKPCDLLDLRRALDEALAERAHLREQSATLDRLEELERRVEFLARQNIELWTESRRDALTSLPTRQQLADDLRVLQARRNGSKTTAVLSLVDMDDFRRVNMHGYEAGDAAIKRVAEVLRRQTRDCDRVYRWGGDEFVVLIPCDSHERGVRVMERLRAAVERERPLGAGDPVTLSAGVAPVPAGEGRTLTQLIEEANDYLRAAKQRGGNTVVGTRPLRAIA